MSTLPKEIEEAIAAYGDAMCLWGQAHIAANVPPALTALRAAILADREAAVEAARKEEREACMDIAANVALGGLDTNHEVLVAKSIHDKIRSRGAK